MSLELRFERKMSREWGQLLKKAGLALFLSLDLGLSRTITLDDLSDRTGV